MRKLYSKYKTIFIIITVWMIIGIILIATIFTVKDTSVKTKNIISILVKVYITLVPMVAGLIFFIKRKNNQKKEL